MTPPAAAPPSTTTATEVHCGIHANVCLRVTTTRTIRGERRELWCPWCQPRGD